MMQTCAKSFSDGTQMPNELSVVDDMAGYTLITSSGSPSLKYMLGGRPRRVKVMLLASNSTVLNGPQI